MRIIVQYSVDDNIVVFNDRVAYFNAFLLYHSIDKLEVSDSVKKEIFNVLLKI